MKEDLWLPQTHIDTCLTTFALTHIHTHYGEIEMQFGGRVLPSMGNAL